MSHKTQADSHPVRADVEGAGTGSSATQRASEWQRHTPGPWVVEDSKNAVLVVSETPGLCASINVNTPTKRDRANAARIVACVNACEGMDDPAATLARLRLDATEATTLRERLAEARAQRDELRAENERLREALQRVAESCDAGHTDGIYDGSLIEEIARAALAKVQP